MLLKRESSLLIGCVFNLLFLRIIFYKKHNKSMLS